MSDRWMSTKEVIDGQGLRGLRIWFGQPSASADGQVA
jgi:hypothetical protein